jgi:von Willebrand factor type D domain
MPVVHRQSNMHWKKRKNTFQTMQVYCIQLHHFVTCVVFCLMPCQLAAVSNCSELSVQVCHLVGEPHYTSFDHLSFDWQGVCKYNLASYCGRPSLLPPFQIFSKNEHRLMRPAASWPLYVEIHFGGDIVVLGSNPAVITVNS